MLFFEGVYSVEVENEFGCVASDSISVLERCPVNIFLPNVFSPNGDGVNDKFFVQGNDILSLRLRIYNRWGGLVFESFEESLAWDGEFKGQPAGQGVYTWVLVYEGYNKNGKLRTYNEAGTVTLLR